MPSPPTFVVDQNGDPVTRLRFEMTEATVAQAAGPDGGRVSSSQQLVVTATGAPTERLVVDGVNPAHAVVEGSLDESAWADLADGLAVGGTAGDEVDIWVRLIIKRWGTMLSPHIDATLRVGAVEPAAIDEP